MSKSNFERMMDIINDVFETRNDPDQLQVTQEDIERLQKLHPSTLTEYNEGHGPCIWILLIPTTKDIADRFVQGNISENQLLQQTNRGDKFEVIYLCSATTLPEYRGKGITTRLALEAVNAIRSEYPVTSLCVWPFSEEGKRLAEKMAAELKLPLMVKNI